MEVIQYRGQKREPSGLTSEPELFITVAKFFLKKNVLLKLTAIGCK